MILDILSGENDTFIDNSLFYFGKVSKRDRKIIVGKTPGNSTWQKVYIHRFYKKRQKIAAKVDRTPDL